MNNDFFKDVKKKDIDDKWILTARHQAEILKSNLDIETEIIYIKPYKRLPRKFKKRLKKLK